MHGNMPDSASDDDIPKQARTWHFAIDAEYSDIRHRNVVRHRTVPEQCTYVS